jgi:predicted metal-binding protein
MRKRKGFFEGYTKEESVDLIGLVQCAGCPTKVAPGKILRKIRSLVEYKIDALHFAYCMTTLCPFLGKYEKEIKNAYPDLKIVRGTHRPVDAEKFREAVREMLCPTIKTPQDMNDLIQRTFVYPEG